MGEYGNYIYGVDDTTTGNVYKTNKIDGKPVKLFQIPELVYSAVEDSKGEVYILDKQNTVQEFTPENKFKRKIKLDGIQAAAWLEVDPKDNFYIVDSANSVITKFDHDFKPVTHFGGIGEGKTNFTNCGKIYAGPNDTLYCVNMTKADGARVKIMDSRGNFIKEWPVKKMAKFSNLSNLAITRSGFVYINSFEESKVFIFDSNGNFMGSFDTDKNKRFLITYPSSMTGGKNGLLYIATHETAIFRTTAY